MSMVGVGLPSTETAAAPPSESASANWTPPWATTVWGFEECLSPRAAQPAPTLQSVWLPERDEEAEGDDEHEHE